VFQPPGEGEGRGDGCDEPPWIRTAGPGLNEDRGAAALADGRGLSPKHAPQHTRRGADGLEGRLSGEGGGQTTPLTSPPLPTGVCVST